MDVESIEKAIPVVTGHMLATGYSRGYTDGVRRSASWLMYESGCESWDDVPRAIRERWSSPGTICAVGCQLRIIRQYVEEGVLPREDGRPGRRSAPPKARDGLCPSFAEVIDAYESSCEAASKKPTTVSGEASNAAAFLSRLEALGRTSPAEVTEDDLIEVLTGPDGGPAYSPSHVKQVKAVLSAARSVEGCGRMAAAMPVPKRWRKVKSALSEVERHAVAETLDDPPDGLSQRDRAIGCLLLYTGMRASDVSALELGSIDWEGDVIRLTQAKTGVPLRLPLVPQVGNAIFDYVTGDRPPVADTHVFLTESWPHGPLGRGTVGDAARRVLGASGVDARGGARLFRRTLATSMMGAGIDRSVVAATLGHTSPKTSEGYMVADVEGLRRCSLDVSRFPIREGALS